MSGRGMPIKLVPVKLVKAGFQPAPGSTMLERTIVFDSRLTNRRTTKLRLEYQVGNPSKSDSEEKTRAENVRMGRTILELERKRKASEVEQAAKDDMIALLLPPKSVKNEYLEQTPAKYVFKCKDGDIQIPEYGISRTDFYYQAGILKLRPPKPG